MIIIDANVLSMHIGDSNISLHEVIVTQINTIYQPTIKILTQINDNLTKAQAVIEVLQWLCRL